jgi:hypothetical protein
MRRLPPVLLGLLAALAVLAAGCGAAGSSAGDFEGAEEEVAQVVEDVEQAATEDEPRRVCTQLLARPLAQRLGRNCLRVVQSAFDQADTYALKVDDVRVTDNRARARVLTGRDEDPDEAETLELVREANGWRLASLGAG